MQIAVDQRQFGPETIGSDGRFAMSIVVPPGGRAIGTSTDRLGNQQRRELDLALPPFPRLLLGAVPPELPADGHARAEIVAFAIDARGHPERRAPPALTCSVGALSLPTARGDGSWTWTFTAPAKLGSTNVDLQAANTRARIGLRPGPPRQLRVSAGEPLGAGSDQPTRVEVHVADGVGSPVTGARLKATLQGGRVLGVEEIGAGSYAVVLVPPRDPGRGQASLHVEVEAVPSGAPRRLTLHPRRNADGTFSAEAWIDDDLGLPVPGVHVTLLAGTVTQQAESDRYGTARVSFAPPTSRSLRVSAETLELPGVVATLDYVTVGGRLHAVPSVRGSGVIEPGPAPSFPAVDFALPLVPAAPVNLRIEPADHYARAGRPLLIRVQLGGAHAGNLLYQASAGTLALQRTNADGTAELRFVPPSDAVAGRRYLLSVTDARSRVTAFTEVQVR
jgi:hypothetical protein